MDTRTLNQAEGASPQSVVPIQISPQELADRLDHIKRNMPQTYELIVKKAETEGNAVFRAVRLGCMGEANRFWAMEAGHFAGTPFEMKTVQDEIAWGMVNFGTTWAVVFDLDLDKLPPMRKEAGHDDGRGGGDGSH